MGIDIPFAVNMRKKVDDLYASTNADALKKAVDAIRLAVTQGNSNVTIPIELPSQVVRALEAKGYVVDTGVDQRDGGWATINW